MGMTQTFIEYSEVITQILNLEKELTKLFQAQTKSNIQPAYRCRDYNERQIILSIPFDQLTTNNFTQEKIDNINNYITKYLELRIMQTNIELQLDQEKAIDDTIKQTIIQNMAGL
jgi:hypothetical protein